MSYVTSKQKYVDSRDLNLDPIESPTTVDGYSNVIELGKRRCCTLVLNVTSVSASDTLDVSIEGSDDNGSNWYTIVAFTQVSATGTQRKSFVGARQIRAKYDVTGSSVSIASTLRGEAV